MGAAIAVVAVVAIGGAIALFAGKGGGSPGSGSSGGASQPPPRPRGSSGGSANPMSNNQPPAGAKVVGVYQVVTGDTLSKLARRWVPSLGSGAAGWRAIMAVNPIIKDPNNINRGWYLNIPADPGASSSGNS
jgi:nucleoid-associated protein YgaU